MRGALAFALVGAFMVALSWLIRYEIPPTNEQLVTFMLGQLSGFTAAAIAYYLGTSKSSSDKTEMMRKQDEPPPLPRGRGLPQPAAGIDNPDKVNP